jgi:hypothetical protein
MSEKIFSAEEVKKMAQEIFESFTSLLEETTRSVDGGCDTFHCGGSFNCTRIFDCSSTFGTIE